MTLFVVFLHVRFETLTRSIQLISDNDFQLCITAKQRTESSPSSHLNETVLSSSCMPAVPLRDLIWQDVFLEVATALIYPVEMCEK